MFRVSCFFLSSPNRFSAKSVALYFSASLNDVAPVSPMLLSIVMKWKEKSELLMDAFCVFFLLSTIQKEFGECFV